MTVFSRQHMLSSAAAISFAAAGALVSTNVQSALVELDTKKAPLASPGLTGTPTAPTAADGANNGQIATTAFVKTAIAALIASAPTVLDTLDEIAAALNDDPNFAATMTTSLAGKQPLNVILTAFSGLTGAADRLPYLTGANTAALATLTTFGRTLMALADAAAARTAIGAVSKAGDTMTGGLVVPGITTPSTYAGNTALVCGSYGTSGNIRFSRISDAGVLGVSAFHEMNHEPGVSAAHRLYIGAAAFDLKNSGNANAPGTWIDGSDGRVKDERKQLAGALEKVRQLTGYTYRRVDLPNLDGSFRREVGLIAQDVREVLPEAVISSDRKIDSDPYGEGFLSLNYNGVTALLVEVVKVLADRVEALEARTP